MLVTSCHTVRDRMLHDHKIHPQYLWPCSIHGKKCASGVASALLVDYPREVRVEPDMHPHALAKVSDARSARTHQIGFTSHKELLHMEDLDRL
jgi:hypothetical protein